MSRARHNMTFDEAHAEWGESAVFCPECESWKHESAMHLSVCRKCLDNIWEQVFIDESRPLFLEQEDTEPARPKEWPARWEGKVWRAQDNSWAIHEAELYRAWVALVESPEAMFAEVGTTEDTPKGQKVLSLLMNAKLITYKSTQGGWTYHDQFGG